MLSEGRLNSDPNVTLTGMAERLINASLPLERATSIVGLLPARNAASAYMCARKEHAQDGAQLSARHEARL